MNNIVNHSYLVNVCSSFPLKTLFCCGLSGGEIVIELITLSRISLCMIYLVQQKQSIFIRLRNRSESNRIESKRHHCCWWWNRKKSEKSTRNYWMIDECDDSFWCVSNLYYFNKQFVEAIKYAEKEHTKKNW